MQPSKSRSKERLFSCKGGRNEEIRTPDLYLVDFDFNDFNLGERKSYWFAEAQYAGWLKRFLNDPIKRLGNFKKTFETLETANEASKVYYEVGQL